MPLIPAYDFVKMGAAPGTLVKDVLPVHSIMLLAGEPYVGKSLVALDMALAVATGQPFLGRETHESAVLYAGLDSPRWDLALQLRKLATARKITMDEEVLLWFFPDYKLRPLHSDAQAEKALEIIRAHDAKLLVLDTFRMAQLRNENDAGEMAAVLGRARMIAEEGCSIVMTHHVAKPQSEVKRSAIVSARGSGVIGASVDVNWVLTDAGEYTMNSTTGPGPRVEVKVAKGRGLGSGGRRGFYFGIVDLVPDRQVKLHRIEGSAPPIDSAAGDNGKARNRFARLPGSE